MPRERVTGQLAIVVSKFTVKFKVLRDAPLACIDIPASSRKLEFNSFFFFPFFLFSRFRMNEVCLHRARLIFHTLFKSL